MAGLLRSAAGAATGAVVLICVASVALADVTLQQRVSVEGAGMMAVANMSGTTKTSISGERSRTDSDIQLQSRLMRMLAHRAVGPTAEIIRLDQDRIDHLDITRKQYTETTFEDMKAHLQKALDKADSRNQEGPKPMDDSKCEWLEPKADVKRSGEKATYGGFEAERLTVVASQPCKDKETGAICEVALALDEWLAPKVMAAREEEQKFYRAYAQKIGLELTSGGGGGAFGGSDINQRAQSMFGRYSGIWSEILSKTKDVKGYPVKMSFSFALGGTECKNAKGQQPQQASSDDSSSGGSGSLAGQMAGKLGSLFHRKKDDSQGDAAAAPQAAAPAAVTLPDGLVPIITMSSELISVSTDSVSSSVFDVPTDFKKIERQTD